jgi:hypothetical protein
MTYSIAFRRLLGTFTLLVAAPVLNAQAAFSEPVVSVAPVAVVAPVSVGPIAAPVGIARTNVAPSAEPLNLQGTASRRDVSWMIIGGAALVVGSMVDGDAGTIIMVTGAVVGLTGLWRYLQ